MNYVINSIIFLAVLYILVNIVIFLYLLQMVINERKVRKALSLLISYNKWALDNNKKDLVISTSNIDFEFRIGRALFCPFWSYYKDIDVINSLRAYAKSYRYVCCNGHKEWRKSQ